MHIGRWIYWRHGSTTRGARVLGAGIAVALMAIPAFWHFSVHANDSQKEPADAHAGRADPNMLELSQAQQEMIAIGTVAEHPFPLERKATGSVDFNEDMVAQVFPHYPGRLVRIFAKNGDTVLRGQPLFTIQSPDLIQAEQNLISAAGVLDLTTHALERARQLFTVEGIAEKDLQQAVSDQQTAEGALRAACDGVAVFGKTPREIDRTVATRVIDPLLVVPSPISGRIVTRNAAPGDFVQPGTLPAPLSVADIAKIWINAAVTETDMPLVRKGQQVRVSVMALPGREFSGQIAAVGAAVDPQIHRGLIRVEIADAKHELFPGMFASFVIVTGTPLTSLAVPFDGVVREGDGTMSVWLTNDRHRFIRHLVTVGLEDAGYHQILSGVQPGDQVVTKGAIFLDNLAGGDS